MIGVNLNPSGAAFKGDEDADSVDSYPSKISGLVYVSGDFHPGAGLFEGIVITGGSAKMEGVVELSEEIFHMPVRLGLPQYITGLVDVVKNPIFSTGVGLLLFGYHNRAMREAEVRMGGSFRSVRHRANPA